MELGLRGSVIIALSIPHMLHCDSGECHYRPQDPSYATLGLRGVSSSPSGSLIYYIGTQGVSLSPSGSLICYIGTWGCHHRPQDPSSATLGLREVSSLPSGFLLCYTGTQGGVIIALRIPHLLHWDSGGCPYHPQDPSYATMATVTILCGVLLFIKIP